MIQSLPRSTQTVLPLHTYNSFVTKPQWVLLVLVQWAIEQSRQPFILSLFPVP